MVICLERSADLQMAQLMPLPLTASCFSKIQLGLTFLVLAHPDSPGQRPVKRVCMCVCVTHSQCNIRPTCTISFSGVLGIAALCLLAEKVAPSVTYTELV